jgi:hypothetical protein
MYVTGHGGHLPHAEPVMVGVMLAITGLFGMYLIALVVTG